MPAVESVGTTAVPTGTACPAKDTAVPIVEGIAMFAHSSAAPLSWQIVESTLFGSDPAEISSQIVPYPVELKFVGAVLPPKRIVYWSWRQLVSAPRPPTWFPCCAPNPLSLSAR